MARNVRQRGNYITIAEIDEAIRFIYGNPRKGRKLLKAVGISEGQMSKWKRGIESPEKKSADAIREFRKLGPAGTIVRNCLIKHGQKHADAFKIGKEIEKELAKLGITSPDQES